MPDPRRSGNKRSHSLGDLNFSIEGSCPTFDYLVGEFASLPVATGACDVEFRLRGALPETPRGGKSSRNCTGLDRGFKYESEAISYSIEKLDSCLRVTILCPSKEPAASVKKAIHRFFDWNYLARDEALGKDFMYVVFNLVTGLLVAEHGFGCYLHASSMEKGTRGAALIASGGVGKTTSMLRLVSRQGWNYLSDDIGYLDSKGFLLRTPLRMQVYAYNLQGDDDLHRRLMRSRSPLDRLSWHLRLLRKGPKRVRRRVAPEELFGESKVSRSAKLAVAVFLERASVPRLAVSPISSEDLIRKTLLIMPHEIGGIDALHDSLSLIDRDGILPGRQRFVSRCRQIMAKSLAGAQTLLVQVPRDCSPDDLANFLSDVLEPNVPKPSANPGG